MRDFQDKNKNGILKRIFYSTFGIVFLSLLVLAFAWGVVDFMLKMKETVKNKEIAEYKVVELEKRKEKLVRDINDLSTDEGKEAVFRENYGLAKEGEGLIIVVEDKSAEVIKDEAETKEFMPSFSKFFNRLLGK
ncbi:MAG: septum formation initiator family protein [bacterium]|nr:septum formation initiator family protein [bacterium]